MAKKTNPAYVDSSAFIAFLDKSDTYHSLFQSLFSNPPKLVSTPLVISETHAWFLYRYDSYRAIQFLNFIEDLSIKILSVDEKTLSESAKLIRHFSDQKLTLVDAVGLHIIKKEKIPSCWSTDRHLGLTGVPLVIHES